MQFVPTPYEVTILQREVRELHAEIMTLVICWMFAVFFIVLLAGLAIPSQRKLDERYQRRKGN